jgi:hypothetical protein
VSTGRNGPSSDQDEEALDGSAGRRQSSIWAMREQTWLATGPNLVVIPFAGGLAKLVPPVAVRLRRDFKTVLMLVRAHALLHQASRRKDQNGQVVAEIEDNAPLQASRRRWHRL